MNDCRFKVFNFAFNTYVPCTILSKIDNNIWKVREYIENRDGSITIIETCTSVKYIENL